MKGHIRWNLGGKCPSHPAGVRRPGIHPDVDVQVLGCGSDRHVIAPFEPDRSNHRTFLTLRRRSWRIEFVIYGIEEKKCSILRDVKSVPNKFKLARAAGREKVNAIGHAKHTSAYST